MSNLYFEPVAGNVRKVEVVGEDDSYFLVQSKDLGFKVSKTPASDGSLSTSGFPGIKFWPETSEWRDRYQDSLSLKVSQHPLAVYMVMPIKRGRFNSRVLVIDDDGATYHVLVPTVPMPRLGQALHFLRLDLTPVSFTPSKDILDKVVQARKADPLLG
jgi:hypothetical protein